MTFAQLALANIRGSWLRYAAFFLSSVFSVLIFFMYAQFIFHPDVADGYIYGGREMRVILVICQVLVAVFSFFFVLYSSGAFLRARGREFGLLTLMGTTRRQLRRLVWLENTMLSATATFVGTVLGILFTRLFLLGISRVLGVDEPLRFAIVPQALLLTVGGFLLLFQLVTLASALLIGRKTVINMLQSQRRSRPVPLSSWLLALLGFLLVAAGYVAASSSQPQVIALVFLPVIVIVTIGTFLLFGHGGGQFLGRQRGTASYLRGTRMLVVSQLVFRLRDNARLLATVAVLSAVVLTAAGTFYVLTSQFALSIRESYPQPLAVLWAGQDRGLELQPEQLAALMVQNGVVPSLRLDVTVRELQFDLAGEVAWTVVVARSDYERALDTSGLARVSLGTVELPGGVEGERVDTPFSVPMTLWGDWFVVADDQLSALRSVHALEPALLTVYDWAGSGRHGQFERALLEVVPERSRHLVGVRAEQDTALRQALGLSMFAGVFVSLLFFIGSASLIYFKLFTELPDDRVLFARLGRIGITAGEADRVVTSQIATVFLLPFALGALHASFALAALGTLVSVDVTRYTAVVIALFAAVQLLFMLLTRWTYLRALRPAARIAA